jgi:hypothetical protein
VQKIRQVVSEHATPTPATSPAEEMYQTDPRLRDCGVPEEVLLSPYPVIIIQDRTGKCRTEYKEFRPTEDGRSTIPHLYYDSLPGSCPFLPPPTVRDSSKPEVS